MVKDVHGEEEVGRVFWAGTESGTCEGGENK